MWSSSKFYNRATIIKNDLKKASTILEPIMFTNDSNFFYSYFNIHTPFSTVNLELEKKSHWFHNNKLY